MSVKSIKSFVYMMLNVRISYNEEAKARFHKEGKAILRALAKELGVARGQYDLRSNLAGIAVSGEVTLHTDNLYIQLSDTDLGVLWRTCKGRKDYTGGPNQWARWEELYDLPALAEKMKHRANWMAS